MSVLRGIFILAVLAVAPAAPVEAATPTTVAARGGQLEVKARVLPVHTIIVDEQGIIEQIFSNTPKDNATPRVYRVSIAAANEQPITPQVDAAYRRLVPAGQSRIGLLYERNPLTAMLGAPPASSAFSMFEPDHALAFQ